MKILSIPGRCHENKYFLHLLSALESLGVCITPTTLQSLAKIDFDILHLNFPSHYVTECKTSRATLFAMAFTVYLLILRLLRRKIVYTVHDVVALNPRNMLIVVSFMNCVLRLTSGLIFLSPSSRQMFERSYPRFVRKPWVLVAHGPYSTTLITDDARVALRQRVVGNDTGFIIGFLGAVKPYKNIHALSKLQTKLIGGKAIHLVVAGQVNDEHRADVESVIAALPHPVTWIDRRLSDEELNEWIQVVDLVILPYAHGSNSGLIFLTLSNRSRIVCSDSAPFKDIAAELGEPWVYSLDSNQPDCETYSGLIERAALDTISDIDRSTLTSYIESISWSSAARDTAKFYADLFLGERGGPSRLH